MDFHSRALKADQEARVSTRKVLLDKYPYIGLSQFKILTHIDADAKAHPEVVFMDKSSGREIDSHIDELDDSGQLICKEALVANKPKPAFPAIWMPNGDIQQLLVEGKKSYDHWPPMVLDYQINNFRVYVNSKDYFQSELPKLRISTSRGEATWNDREDYYRVLLFTYIASYSCGISMQHLTESPEGSQDPIDKRITSLMRFHVYFTVQRLLRRAEAGESVKTLSDRYNGSALYGKTDLIHRTNYWQNHRLSDGTLGDSIVYQIGDVNNDYKRYVPRISNGITREVGSRLLNDSIAGYVYAVLGAQAKIRASIVNQGAISLQCQDVFRQIVHDSIVSNDVVVGVSNMRRAVRDCNQVVNLAVSPETFLLPSDMTILKERIPGYSNVLYRASEKGMRFGVNHKVNYISPKAGAFKAPKGALKPKGLKSGALKVRASKEKEDPLKPTKTIVKAKEAVRTEASSVSPSLVPVGVVGIVVGYIVSRMIYLV